MKLVEQRISDRKVLILIRKWLLAGIMEEGKVRNSLLGAPQGGVISPLLSNIFECNGFPLGKEIQPSRFPYT